MTDEKNITIKGSISYEEFCGRLGSPAVGDLMYTQDVSGRVGLEVLWLKLSLLSEVIGLSRTTRINLSQCQIKLVSTPTHLPRFWNFRVEVLPAATDVPVPVVLRELGLCWFRTLLVSPGQIQAEVDSALTSLFTASAGNSNLLIESAMHAPALQSTQLFVAKAASHTTTIPPDLWQRALQIGLRLATLIPNFSYSSQTEGSLSGVLGKVLTDAEALRARAATALFIDPPRMEQDLGELLNELIGDPRWLDSLGAINTAPAGVIAATTRPVPAAVAPSEEEQNMESTIIIKRGAAMSSVAPVAPPARVASPPAAPAAEENLEATIIISKDKKR